MSHAACLPARGFALWLRFGGGARLLMSCCSAGLAVLGLRKNWLSFKVMTLQVIFFFMCVVPEALHIEVASSTAYLVCEDAH